VERSKSDKSEVVIVGAGPTGLLAACLLARYGLKFRIIEKNKGTTTQSRALAIHAASMEIFSQIGIADNFVTLGKKVQAVNYFVKGKVKQRIPLSEFGKGATQFPFLLVLEQSKTEKLLNDLLESLGHKVEWETELIDFSQDDHGVKVTVKNAGIDETIQADWLVGADGARSQVRQILDIPFGGQTYPIDLFVLDCRVNWNLKEDELYIAFSDHSFAGFFPMPEGRCRVIGFVPKEASSKEDITFEDVNNGFAERMQMKIELYDPGWISMYHSHHRYVSQFKIGRCFLAGDSAHIHSPVGAQGMNTGFQDAFNLAWKLAFVIKKWAKEDLLNTYQEERLPFARRLVQSTDRAFNMTVSQKGLVKYMRMHIAPRILAILLKIKPVERFLFKNISQIGITYRESLLSANGKDTGFASGAPKPGERLPYLEYEDMLGQRVNIQKRVNATSLHLFIFSNSSKDSDAELIKFLEQYKGVVTYESILFTPSTEKLYKALDVMEGGLYLIRPDLYIAYRSHSLNLDGLKKYLQLFLILNSKQN